MLMSYYERSFIDLFARVQEVRLRPLQRRQYCLGIQEDLLRRIVYVEKRIKYLKSEIKELKAMLSWRRTVRLSKSEAQQVKERIQRHRQMIEEYREVLYLFKSIGDALVFIYIPKRDIKPMAFKEDTGHVHGQEGLRHELKFLRRIFEVDGALAVLNDLTNSLRYGDLTIISERFSGPVEIKAGPRTSRRARRQEAELKEMIRFLAEDQIEGLYGLPGETIRSAILLEEKDHVDDLNKLISDAYRNGFAFSQVEEGLYYWVVVGGHPGGSDIESDQPPGFGLFLEEFEGKQPMFFFVNQSKFDTWGRYPYTLSIRDPQALFDFYSGTLHVNAIVDVGAMAAKFASFGLKMAFEEDENIALTIENTDPAKPDRFDLALSRHFFERVAYEFLSLDWFVEESARLTDFSAFAGRDLSTLQGVEPDHLADDHASLALSQARQLALRRRERADR